MRKLLFTAISATLLVTAQAHAWGRNSLLVPVEVAAACATRVGAQAPMILDYPVVDGYFRLVQVRTGYGVTAEQSNRINACIAHYAGFNVEEVKPLFGKKAYLIRFNRCPTGVMVSADSYCIKDARY